MNILNRSLFNLFQFKSNQKIKINKNKILNNRKNNNIFKKLK